MAVESPTSNTDSSVNANPKYTDWGTIVLLALSFALVGIDRFLITILFPEIKAELGLDYTQLGIITGALAFSWGLASLIMGNQADRIGRGKVLIWSMLVFSLLIGASGLAAGLFSLILVRIVMGFADGAFTPASIAATIEAAGDKHRGLAIGAQQMMLPAVGLGLAPLLVIPLLKVMDWRLIFAIFSIPGFLLTFWMWKRYGGERIAKAVVMEQTSSSLDDWKSVLGYRNIWLAMVLMLCWLTCLITTSAFLPSYLQDHIGLAVDERNIVISAIGWGAALGTLSLLWLSDKVGLKNTLLLASLGALASLIMFYQTGSNVGALYLTMFMLHFFNNAAITITVGPLCAATVSPKLIATASGVVIAAGEILGGGIAPIAAGWVSTEYGIDKLLIFPMGGLIIAFILSLFLQQQRSRRDI